MNIDSWRDLIPTYGDRTVRQRIWELEQKAGSLPVLFAVLFGAYVTAEARNVPVPFLPERYRILLIAIVVALLFVYRDRRERAVKKAKEKAEEIAAGREQTKLVDYSSDREKEEKE